VVLNGVSDAYSANRDTFALPYQYILYPGNYRSYKNLGRLFVAYAASRLPKQGIHLVLTGVEAPGLVHEARRLSVGEFVHFLGGVKSEDLPKVYKGALAVAFVSLYEGFGLPIIEGMASGVPVLTSNVSAMPEVAGDAAMIVDPSSVSEITRGLELLVTDPVLRNELVHRGLERVIRFDWTRSAHELWTIVDRVAAGR
jgi:glycosyltransferase involved in cell wall biosynthesis